jgi:hypothetical protein
MELSTKAQVARMTLTVLTVVVSLFFLGLLVVVLCAGLQINPFKETTTSFLVAIFCGLIGAAAILVLLNIATNISLIADAKISELKIEPRPGLLKKWMIRFAAVVIILVAVVFGGTYLSKERYLGIVRSQADEVIKENKSLLEEVSRLLAAGKPEDYKRIFDIHNFLEHQRSGLPQLTLIYSGTFAGKPALYQIGSYFSGDLDKNTYSHIYFRCTRDLDCDYLTRFFTGNEVGVLQKYTIRDDQFYIYIPVNGKEARFILLFQRTNSYGKLGS